MITNNFRIALQGICANSTTNYKSLSGTNVSVTTSGILYYNNIKIILGSGDNTPVGSDYSLESQINDLTELVRSTEPNTSGEIDTFDNATAGIITTTTFKNETENAITVNELGVVGGNSLNVLLIRELLDTPVVIEPNQSYSFTVTIG